MFIKVALEDLSPAMIVFLRTALATLLLVPLAAWRGAFAGLADARGVIGLLAVVQVAGPFLLITAGEQAISSSLAGILVASAPLWTALLAIWVDHAERSTGWRLSGLVAGFVGVGLLIGVDLSGSGDALLGGGAVVLAGLGYALGGFIVKRGAAAVRPLGVAAVTVAASAAITAPLALLTAPDAAPSAGTVGAVLALGLGGTGLAFVIFNTLVVSVGPARASLVSYIIPVFAVVFGVVLLGEHLTPGALAGIVLITAGSWLAAGGSLRTRRSGVRALPVDTMAGADGGRAASSRGV